LVGVGACEVQELWHCPFGDRVQADNGDLWNLLICGHRYTTKERLV
jgi:hypothetical protein